MAIVELVDRDVNAKGLPDKERLKNQTNEKKLAEAEQKKVESQNKNKESNDVIKDAPEK